MSDTPFAERVWSELAGINVNNHTNKKGNLTYLSWAWAWATLMSKFPASTYTVMNNVVFPDQTVETWIAVTVREGEESLERAMWLPVMDNRNNAIERPTGRQISDTRMRCLTKCLSMFGLGHYIYAGEDLPSEEKEQFEEAQKSERESTRNEFVRQTLQCLEDDDGSGMLEIWSELDDDEKHQMWREFNSHQKGKIRGLLNDGRSDAAAGST